MKGISLHRGEIWYANLSPGVGSEQTGVRPCVIIQNNTGNEYSPTTLIAPCTTGNKPPIPTHIILEKGEGNMRGKSIVLLEQIRAIDTSRLRTKIGELDENAMQLINQAISISVGLTDI